MTRRAHARAARWASSVPGMLIVRVIGIVVVLFVISALVFLLLHLAPGDIVRNIVGAKQVSPEVAAEIRRRYHLDAPLPMQYASWLGHILRGDAGYSIQAQDTVIHVVGQTAGPTILLCVLAFIFVLITAVPLGVLAARQAGRAADTTISASALVGLSTPSFVTALILLYTLAYYVPLFPVYGQGQGGFGDTLHHMVLPAAALAIGLGAIVLRITRAAVLEELGADYAAFALARGLSESRVLMIALRNAAIPITTSAGLVLTYMVGGSILVEVTFSIQGIGQLVESSVLFKDYAVVQFLVLVIAAVIAVVMLLVDFTYLVLDPRVRTRTRSTGGSR